MLEYIHIRLRAHELQRLVDKWRRKVNNNFSQVGLLLLTISIVETYQHTPKPEVINSYTDPSLRLLTVTLTPS